jgi:hypothetical protein
MQTVCMQSCGHFVLVRAIVGRVRVAGRRCLPNSTPGSLNRRLLQMGAHQPAPAMSAPGAGGQFPQGMLMPEGAPAGMNQMVSACAVLARILQLVRVKHFGCSTRRDH